MEKNTINSVVKQLSVILTREPLVGQRYKNEQLQHHNDYTASIQSNCKMHVSGEVVSSSKKKSTAAEELKNIHKRYNVPYKECNIILERFNVNTLREVQNEVYNKLAAVDNFEKHVSGEVVNYSKEKSTASEELINIHKRHNIPYKQCKIILERFNVNMSKEVQNGVYDNKLVVVDKNVNNYVDINCGKQLASGKLPVYNQTTADTFKDKSDLYEFDEVDTENVQDVNKAKCKKKKKTKSSKQISKIIRKKQKIDKIKVSNTYDATVQGILHKVMKKVTNSKLINKGVTPIQHQTPHEHNMNVSIQLRNLSNVDNVGNCNNGDTEIDATISGKNKEIEIFCEQNAENNNSEMACSFYRPLNGNKKIHIISDITLDESLESDDSFFNDDLQPDANSTVLLNKQRSPPWRFNDNVKRNPHYLSIKKTALPCLQQDMIIDHTQLQKIVEHFAKIPTKPKKCVNKPTPIEESGLFHDTADKENVHHSRLFERENFVNQLILPVNKQKRSILGQIQNANYITNIINVPRNNAVEIPASVNKIPKLSNAETPGKNLDTTQNSLKESVNGDFVVKLFEDEEPVINFDENSKIYVPKIRKKKKLLYHNIEEPHQDKHKREMTRKEEAELEQWAAKFNSLCEDIESYKLDIE